MMIKITATLIVLVTICSECIGQNLGLTFQEAEAKGISISKLDSLYQSAVHVDTSQAVFKTDSELQAMQQSYIKLLQDLGDFLSENDFHWKEPTRCFNRIYFDSDGTIDYFLFNFLGKPEDIPSAERQKEFERLLNTFIEDYQFPLSAEKKFAQCSPTTYMPN